jgi:Bacterial protein of unknown function (DUF899)
MRGLFSRSGPSRRNPRASSESQRNLCRRVRAPIEEIEVVRKRMGWKFPWVSSYHSDFNYDFNVSFTPEQVASGRALYNYQEAPAWVADLQDLSGDSVFFKDSAGQIFHTYSTFGRGGEEFLGIYRYLDATPKGRDENGPYHTLGDWVRPRNLYGQGGMVEANGRYHQPGCACAVAARRSEFIKTVPFDVPEGRRPSRGT